MNSVSDLYKASKTEIGALALALCSCHSTCWLVPLCPHVCCFTGKFHHAHTSRATSLHDQSKSSASVEGGGSRAREREEREREGERESNPYSMLRAFACFHL